MKTGVQSLKSKRLVRAKRICESCGRGRVKMNAMIAGGSGIGLAVCNGCADALVKIKWHSLSTNRSVR
jgi:hypothetical protein